ncbi:hypothetical protein Tco_0748021 [Tanacetum coccineum]|uniref:Transposase n=1 Tax=Tanacetum coccineum TaxID=301880 RepID=A0ABQ4YUM7_9ASTR
MLAATWSLRLDGHSLDSYNEYRNHPTAFTLKINHGGTLTSPSNVRYRGGKANWFDDVDEILFLLLKCKQCCDKDVMEMCQYVSQCKVMDVFVIHPISEPELVSNEDIDNEFDHLFSYPDNNTYKDRPSGSNAGKSPSGSNAGKRPSVIEDVDGSDSSAASEDSEDSDDSEFDVGDEDRIEDVEVDMDDFRKHTDENVEWVECNEEEVQVPPPFDYEEVDLEDFGSGTESDDLECARKGALKKLAKAHRPVDGQMYTENFYVGQSLANKQLIKEMVSKLFVAQRRQLWFTRNDKTRMRAECRGFVPIFRKVQWWSLRQRNPGYGFWIVLEMTWSCSETPTSPSYQIGKSYIYDKLEVTWMGRTIQDSLMEMSTATTVQRFGKNMEEIKKFDPEMYKWLKDIPPQHWARSHFSGIPHCDVLLNNMCEVLNRQLLNGRDKPIITCLEFIREYLMKRIVIVQGIIGKSIGPLTPNATKIFNVIKRDAASIRKWEITGMPCKHAVACIWDMANNGLEPGIPESYTPITLTPPNYKPPVGRPRKKRRKSAAEIYDNLVKKGKLSRAGKTVTCLKFTKSTANRLSPLKKKFVGLRPAATQKNGVPKPTAATKKKDVSKAKGKQKKN